MRLTRGVFSEVAHDPILDASSAPDLLKIRLSSVNNTLRGSGLQSQSPFKPLNSRSKGLDRFQCRVQASGASLISKMITNDTHLPV